MDAFVEQFWLARGVPESKMQNAGFYDHFLSWYHRRHDQDVLFLFFEDLKENLQREVEKVARFMSTFANKSLKLKQTHKFLHIPVRLYYGSDLLTANADDVIVISGH